MPMYLLLLHLPQSLNIEGLDSVHCQGLWYSLSRHLGNLSVFLALSCPRYHFLIELFHTFLTSFSTSPLKQSLFKAQVCAFDSSA